MVQYITIPIRKSTSGVNGITFNVDLISTVLVVSTTTFAVYSQGRTFTFTTVGSFAKEAVIAITRALPNSDKPVVSTVVFPSNVVIALIPTVA